jgi:RNA polymerase sigma factor (sigma-70 family)
MPIPPDYGLLMTSADHATLDRILRDYAGFAHRLAASYEADPETIRDLTQEILVAVWRAWPAFRRQCSERTYVARIAHLRIASHVERAVRQPRRAALEDDMPAPGPTPEEQVVQQDLRARLMDLVRTLPVAYREVALLLLEDFTPAEVADTLGITANAVAIRSTRAREMLRALLEQRP